MGVKTGKDFELLVSRIEKCLHSSAIVTPNDKIPDIHTGRKRQIDISIRLKSNYISLLTIVELRDRNRPVTVEAVEQIAKKRESVAADAAVIVSASGFCETARRKAQSLGLRTVELAEVAAADWSGWISARSFEGVVKRYEMINTTLQVDEPDLSLLGQLPQMGQALVFRTHEGEEHVTLQSLIEQVMNNEGAGAWDGLEPNMPPRRLLFKHEGVFDPELYVSNSLGQLRRLIAIEIALVVPVRSSQSSCDRRLAVVIPWQYSLASESSMPLPKPHYQPSFTPDQLAHARKVAAQTSAPFREVQRARLALVLAEHPELSHAEIGARCGLDDETVYKWRRRWTTHGFSLTDAPRSGRPRAFPPGGERDGEGPGL